jgi:hypothetical protein
MLCPSGRVGLLEAAVESQVAEILAGVMDRNQEQQVGLRKNRKTGKSNVVKFATLPLLGWF